jgi:hypothetical protein
VPMAMAMTDGMAESGQRGCCQPDRYNHIVIRYVHIVTQYC